VGATEGSEETFIIIITRMTVASQNEGNTIDSNLTPIHTHPTTAKAAEPVVC
jgi:hypothetical protein